MSTTPRPQSIAELKEIETVPVMIANQQGLITYINAQFEEVLGWTPDDIIGELITIILPTSFQDSHNLAFSRFQATERANVLNHPLELKTIMKNQEAIMTEHYILAEKLGEEWFFGATLTPLNQ